MQESAGSFVAAIENSVRQHIPIETRDNTFGQSAMRPMSINWGLVHNISRHLRVADRVLRQYVRFICIKLDHRTIGPVRLSILSHRRRSRHDERNGFKVILTNS